jgi:Fur family ferric uptake transcriptional regulator
MKKSSEEILSSLADQGFRMTRLRKAIIGVFTGNSLPMSADELMDILRAGNTAFNRTTVYREIGFLKDRGVIQEIQFLHERVKRYELASLDHHHHLVCLRCKKVEDIVLENDLADQERSILNSKGFKVTNHMLEFHGICRGCYR